MSGILMAIAAFVLALFLLVAVHEWGHFWVARRFGVKVLRFSLGFGKPLLRHVDKHGTEFVLSLLPLGGYVKMLDEREGVVQAHELGRAFNRKPVGVRMAVVAAGPFFNLLFAVLCYWLVFSIGFSVLAPVVGQVRPGSLAAEAGLQKGDEIIAVDKQPTVGWKNVEIALLKQLGEGNRIALTLQNINSSVRREASLPLNENLLQGREPDLIANLGMTPYQPPVPPVVGRVIAGQPGALAGLLPGDRITRVAGLPVNDWQDMVDFIRKRPHQAIAFNLIRDGKPLTVIVHTEAKKDGQGYAGVISEPLDWPSNLTREVHYSLWGAWSPAFRETVDMTGLTLKLLGKMLTGQVSTQSIAGPIGIAKGAGETASQGFSAYMNFLALISIGLAVLNILPIPALDGGYLMYYLFELVRGRPLSERVQSIGFGMGLGLLLGLIVFAFYNDIARLLT